MKKLSIISIFFLFLLTGCSGNFLNSNIQPADLTILVTSSLDKPMEDIKASFEANNNITLNYEMESSEEITKSIMEGKLVDLIILSSEKNMDELMNNQLIDPNTRNNLVSNSLVVITQAGSTLSSLDQLATSDVNKIAIADPKTTSSGHYTQETLNALNLTDSLSSKLETEKNVQMLLREVESQRAEAGIVFKSDAVNNSNIKIVYEFPPDINDTIYYPMAVSSETQFSEQAKVVEDYLLSSEAQQIFNSYGFGTVAPAPESETPTETE